MKLKKREKMLLGVVGGIIALTGVMVFFMVGDSRPDDLLNSDKERLTGELAAKEKEVRKAEEDARRLADWQKRSLPSNTSIARSLYQNWLRVLCDRSGLKNPVVQSEDTESHLKIYTRIPFTIHAQANLEQIVSFLNGFYSAGHLHQIRRLKIAPIPNLKDVFEVHIAIEGISLPDAASKDQLTTETVKAPTLSQLATDRAAILKRNFFAVYVPESGALVQRTVQPDRTVRVETSAQSRVDVAKYAVVSGFTQDEEDGLWRVWLRDRTKDKIWQLKEGDEFKVGASTGQIHSINPEDGNVILRFDGKLRELHLDENLRGGKEIKE